MCNICIDYQKGVLTKQEARKNLGEIEFYLEECYPDSERMKHLEDVKKMLEDDQPETD